MTKQLVPYGEGLWIATDLEHRMLGLKLGTRMTVIRLDAGLAIHSPIALRAPLRREIEALGEVRHIIAPNSYHHVYAGEHQSAWPTATMHAPRALQKKRRDLRIDALLEDPPPATWKGVLEPHPIAGCELHETVLLHVATRTIVSSDLVENFHRMDHLPTKLYLQSGGVWQRPGWHPLLRVVYRDRRAARASLDRILALDFDRLILAHGDPIERGAKDAVSSTYQWLRR